MKTNLDGLFKTDESIEKQGVWYELAPGVAFLIKRFGGYNSPTIKSALAKYYKPYAKQIENGTLDQSKEKEIMNKVFVEACIVDWKGIVINGENAQFSVDACVKLMGSLPEMADILIAHASDFKNYKEDLGNF
jgi:hypothetical protein